MAGGNETLPLTAFQGTLLAILARNARDDNYLAGGAAIHFSPDSIRCSDDLDFFHDSLARVASAFEADRARLEAAGLTLSVEISQPGFVRAIVQGEQDATRIDWAHDSAWRFLPLVRDPLGGLVLHPTDLALNKVLTLAGRDEARDFVDTLYVHERVLPLGALVWAATGKDPGFSPLSLLELLRRRGRYHAEDFTRLHLTSPFDLVAAKSLWSAALNEAEAFARAAPPAQAGCLYYSHAAQDFVMPSPDDIAGGRAVPHFGRPAGVLPRIVDA